MKNNIKYIIKIFLITTGIEISACTSSDKIIKDHQIINIADNIGKGYLLNISEVAGNIEYIPLETNDSSILGNVKGVGFSNDYFVVNSKFSSKEVFKIFERNGKYFNTVDRKGRGPKEYSVITSSDIYNEHVVILSYNKIIEYSFEGKFIRSIPLSKDNAPLGYYLINKLDDNHFLLTAINSFKTKNKYAAFILDSNSNEKMCFEHPKSEFEIAKNMSGEVKGLRSATIFTNNAIGKVITGFNEYIISQDKEYKNIDTLYEIDFGKYKITKKNINKRNTKSKLINLIFPILESDNFIFFSINLNMVAHKPMKMKNISSGRDVLLPHYCALYDKRDGSFRLIDQPEDYQKGFIDDLEGGPAFWPNYISDDEYMVSFISAYEFIEHARTHKVSDRFKKIADGLKETDNPVLVMVKLRK